MWRTRLQAAWHTAFPKAAADRLPLNREANATDKADLGPWSASVCLLDGWTRNGGVNFTAEHFSKCRVLCRNAYIRYSGMCWLWGDKSTDWVWLLQEAEWGVSGAGETASVVISGVETLSVVSSGSPEGSSCPWRVWFNLHYLLSCLLCLHRRAVRLWGSTGAVTLQERLLQGPARCASPTGTDRLPPNSEGTLWVRASSQMSVSTDAINCVSFFRSSFM